MGRVSRKVVTRKHKKKLRKLLQILDSSSDSDTSSASLERPGTDSDSDAPLINLVSTQNLAPTVSNEQGAQNILELLGTTTAIKGPEVNPDVAALLSGFLLNGIEKDSRKATLESYPCLANCLALQPPKINPEIRPCVNTEIVKQDTFLSKLQLQLAAGISALAVGFDNKQYELTKANSTDETRKELEQHCAPLKLFADVFHALSLHRRYSILPLLNTNVRKILDDCPIDEFLFSKVFPDQLKTANEAQRLSSSIKKKDKALRTGPSTSSFNKKPVEQKPGPSRVFQSQSLNFRRLQHKPRMKKEEGRPRPTGSALRSYRN